MNTADKHITSLRKSSGAKGFYSLHEMVVCAYRWGTHRNALLSQIFVNILKSREEL